MIRLIQSNMIIINTQEFSITLCINDDKYNTPKSNQHRILQQEQQVQ